MLVASQLTKTYGPTLAVDRLSLELQPGQIVGFLGPNGAGKSTTIRMLTGYLPPTAGRATLDGHDVLTQAAAARRKLGYLPESNPLYPEMRVDEYLHFAGKLQGMDRKRRTARMDRVTDRCGLSKLRRRTIGRLSKGNRQRVGIAAALLHEPPVLILDEPTSGLDPTQIGHIRQLIRDLAGKHTVLLSSHILPEVQKVADRLVIIAGGRIVADGTPSQLQRQGRERSGGASTVIAEVRGPAEVVKSATDQLSKLKEVWVESRSLDAGWQRLEVVPADDRDARAEVGRVLRSYVLELRELREQTPSLEELFVRITDVQRKAGAA